MGSHYECLLLGTVHAYRMPQAIELLRGLCYAEEKPFHVWEFLYKLDLPGVPPSELLVRCALDDRDPAWALRYVGRPLQSDKLAAAVRTIVDVKTSDNINTICSSLGYKFDTEWVRQGFLFKTARNLTVAVFRVFKLAQRHKVETGVGLDDTTWMVQVTALASKDSLGETNQDMANIIEFLSPTIDVSKLGADKLAFIPPPLPPAAGPSRTLGKRYSDGASAGKQTETR